MCGIAGSFGFGASTGDIVARMNDAQRHRGPDGEGTFTGGSIGLAHRRLSVIDHEGGAQPFYSEDRRYAMAYNGEVYNFTELREELTALGHTFTTASDTEVVLHSYMQWGTEAFDRFNGMFAIAIADTQTDTLVIARDHFGIKPVYYWFDEQSGRLLFGSEIKSILAAEQFTPQPNDRAVYRYLKFRVQDEGDETFFQDIRRVRSGEVVTITEGGLSAEKYTTLEEDLKELAKTPGTPYSEKVRDEYGERLRESIRMRLQADVSVGTSLSGGLDSSAVAAVIAEHLKQGGDDDVYDSVGSRQNTFSAVFPKSNNDEEAYVDSLLNRYDGQIAAHKIHPDASSFLTDLEDFVRTQEEPIISTGPYAQYVVMREATKHVTVLLDGQGADEMMAGYNPYYYVYWRQLKARKQFFALAKEMFRSRDIARKLLMAKMRLRNTTSMEPLLNSEFAERFRNEKVSSVSDNLKMRLIEDTFHNSLPSLLRYEDKNTMRFSLEGRVPFVDKELMRYLFTLSEDAILSDGWNKRILRESMDPVLPDMISKRRNKIGFTTPEQEWFVRIKNSLYAIFKSDSFASRPYFDAPTVIALFEDYIKHPKNHGTLLFWRILNVELWMRQFIDPANGVAEKKAEKVIEHKSPFVANPGKELDIRSSHDQKTYRRYPIQTGLVDRDTRIEDFTEQYLADFAQQAKPEDLPAGKDWYLFISEKIIAISQGRSYFTWEIKPSIGANVLSRFVTRTPAGIGLGSPFTMELAIREAGLPRIAGAALAGAVGKLVGRKGLFYDLAGANVRAIDGPTEYSAYPSNVSAKLPPKDPDAVARRLSAMVRGLDLPADVLAGFQGTVVMDANDLGRNVLGSDVSDTEAALGAMFADNPLGQGRQQTPLAIVIRQD
ncbi:asparagine synthase (glutamine-hydrolyzing) [Helcobacillus massiliensis]|uniref:asparagine synthase (glutamine-hydrolyzing) n=1 Tax=Helcobacillus massiliensis TaxID=521392 RepID=A0A839QUD3_9MICO|nr:MULTISPECIES: asparagine synthase (glutamine-hydrolyzing) [Helcobacillus]MBB3022390.1 asparagine synthase (glutamine-hydrolyzing) [Helcobacillus massiliensis]MCG7426966.1 asparagine synthase (glutamine-hydrolyzing) [Helcobacillus sp. ACRRO]MCT1557028.1 asparagine synthase (glutamine-hydrolyzing) [Helcobacillus massiliensis]MCT2035417.1 asparagine synthase (glutamine-hydrolyzing) [Helcobacillus massiliensis]MCT2331368.1 asparagine synthase (glutamine-hydrolyzing) [Helcobacillus massiliensis]